MQAVIEEGRLPHDQALGCLISPAVFSGSSRIYMLKIKMTHLSPQGAHLLNLCQK